MENSYTRTRADATHSGLLFGEELSNAVDFGQVLAAGQKSHADQG